MRHAHRYASERVWKFSTQVDTDEYDQTHYSSLVWKTRNFIFCMGKIFFLIPVFGFIYDVVGISYISLSECSWTSKNRQQFLRD